MPARRLLRLLSCLAAAGLWAGAWMVGCGSFSATDPDSSDAAAQRESGGDGAAVDGAPSTASDGAVIDGGFPEGGSRGCSSIDAAACFDFDNVTSLAEGWSSFLFSPADEPTLTPNGISPPNAARFALTPQPAGATTRSSALLFFEDKGLPTKVQAKLLVEDGLLGEYAYVFAYDLGSAGGGNAVNLFYKCAGKTCAVSVIVYTRVDDAGTTLTPLDCGTFVRGEWTTVGLALFPGTPMGAVNCTLNGKPVSKPIPPFAPGGSPHWKIGVGDQNPSGQFGGEVVYFDDIAFR